MNNQDFNNKPEVQENTPKAFLKGLGVFALSLFLAILTVVIIYL